jgi:hypothetical protein
VRDQGTFDYLDRMMTSKEMSGFLDR